MSGRRKDYYPSYYQDKRRREHAVLVLSAVVVGVAVLGLIILALVYILRPRENLEQLAQRRSEIVEPAIPATGPAPTETPPPVDENLLKPEDVTDTASSVPEMSLAPVQLSGGEVAADTPPPPQMTPEQSAAQPGDEATPVLPADESASPAKPADGSTQATPDKPKAAEEKKPEVKKPVAKPAAETPKKVTPKKPAPKKETKPAEPVYRYNVFAGTYDSEAEAAKQKEHLIEMGLSSSVTSRSSGDAKTYVVAVGSSLDTYDKAVALKNKLREAGFSSAYILRRET
jgi:cell division protein FtsN